MLMSTAIPMDMFMSVAANMFMVVMVAACVVMFMMVMPTRNVVFGVMRFFTHESERVVFSTGT